MASSTDTVYLKIEQNVLVREPSVVLKDIAKITSTNRPLLNKLKQMKIYTFHIPVNQRKKKKQVEVFSVLKIIELIGKEFPNIEVQNIGEKDFIIEYEPKQEPKWLLYLKTAKNSVSRETFSNDLPIVMQ